MTDPADRQTRELLQGDLSNRNLPEYLQFLHGLGRDGQLLIEAETADGEPLAAGLYLEQGHIVHATCPPWEGLLAFDAILSLRSGRFVFLAGARPATRTIDADFHGLLLDGMRRQDELQELSRQLPDWDRPLQPVHDARLFHKVRLSCGQWRLLESVDGRHDIRALLSRSQRDAIAVLADLRHLRAAGLIAEDSDTGFLAAIVLRRLPPASRHGITRPPGQLGAHLLRAVDGRRDLAAIAAGLPANDHEIVAATRQLLWHRWAAVVAGTDEVARHLA